MGSIAELVDILAQHLESVDVGHLLDAEVTGVLDVGNVDQLLFRYMYKGGSN